MASGFFCARSPTSSSKTRNFKDETRIMAPSSSKMAIIEDEPHKTPISSTNKPYSEDEPALLNPFRFQKKRYLYKSFSHNYLA